MSNPLDLPAELLALIEKREQGDRRDSSDAQDERSGTSPVAIERRQSGRRAEDCDRGQS